MSRPGRNRPAEFVVETDPPFTFPEIQKYREQVEGRTHYIDLQNGQAVVKTPDWEWEYVGVVTFCPACGTRLTDADTCSLRVQYASHYRRCRARDE